MTLPQWVESQHKAFLRWCNMHLEAEGHKPITNLQTDLSNGVRLIHLVEAVSHESMGKYHENPKAMQAYENIGIALQYMKHRGIVLHGIGAPDIADGNLKLILGLIWMMILQYAVQDISEDGCTAKEGLLLWCQRKTSAYGVDVRDFQSSWKSGLAFCALMDNYRPDLIEFSAIEKLSPRERIELALKAAEETGIPRLVEVEDVCQRPDEKAMVTYLAYWFHAFSSLDKLETAGARVERFFEVFSAVYKMRREYERRMRTLLSEINSKISEWKSAELSDSLAVKAMYDQLRQYKLTTKRQWISEKADLIELFGNLRIKLATYNLKDYTAAKPLSIAQMNQTWAELLRTEAEWSQKVARQFQKYKDKARVDFAELANDLALTLANITLNISELTGELESQLVGITEASEALAPLDCSVDELERLDNMCLALGVEENDHTVYTFDELVYELELAKVSVRNKLAFIENHLVVREMSNVSPSQLEEFEVVFRHFDKTGKNELDRREFEGALASLGIVFNSLQEADDVWDAQAENGKISFPKFIMYMVSVTGDRQSIDQLRQSLSDISGGKPYLTRPDLENALLSDDVINSLVDVMPCVGPDRYDYMAYVDNIAECDLLEQASASSSSSDSSSRLSTSSSHFSFDGS